MRELDHRLRVSETATHFISDFGRSAIEFLIQPRETFSENTHFMLHFFRTDVEVPTDLRRVRLEQASEIVVRHRTLIARANPSMWAERDRTDNLLSRN